MILDVGLYSNNERCISRSWEWERQREGTGLGLGLASEGISSGVSFRVFVLLREIGGRGKGLYSAGLA